MYLKNIKVDVVVEEESRRRFLKKILKVLTVDARFKM